jgi:endoglucanase
VAVMAEAARAFRPFDEAYSNRCLAAAKKSYLFLQAHPEDHRPDLSAFSTGTYDSPDVDDRLWASVEMWETTADNAILHEAEQRIRTFGSRRRTSPSTVDAEWDWGNLRNLAAFTYLLSENSERDPALVSVVRQDAIRVADEIVDRAHNHPYGRPLGSTYYWGCNGTVARQAMNLHIAHRLTGDAKYRETMLDAINYLFGRNPFGRSLVTGLGRNPPLHPHDRRSGGDNVDAPWPGYLVGGPWPKETNWSDDQSDFRTNEIAINWNGALIYALAAFVEPKSFDDCKKAAESAAPSGPPSR